MQVHSVDVVCMDMLLALSKRLCQAVDLLVSCQQAFECGPFVKISSQGKHLFRCFAELICSIWSPPCHICNVQWSIFVSSKQVHCGASWHLALPPVLQGCTLSWHTGVGIQSAICPNTHRGNQSAGHCSVLGWWTSGQIRHQQVSASCTPHFAHLVH